MAAAEISIAPFLDKVSNYILNPLITLVFALSFLIFISGIVKFINSETSDGKREEGKDRIVWGLVGMFIMFSAYGIIRIILISIGVKTDTGYLSF